MYLFAAVISILIILALIRPAHMLGLVDKPNHRKTHEGEVPLVGGLGIWGSFSICLGLFSAWHGFVSTLMFPLFLLFVICLLDDRLDLSARFRLLVQVAAVSFLFFYGQVRITHLGNLFGSGDIHLNGFMSYLMTVVGMVGVINALNMLDGLDGLAGGIGLIASIFFGFAAERSGLMQDSSLMYTLAAAIAGFLVLNMRTPWLMRAKVFMGDAGSMCMGLVLACMAVRLSMPGGHAVRPIGALWILGLPITDTVIVMTRRVLKGRNPFAPDQEHLHHILQRAGFSVHSTVYLMLSLSAILGWIGLSASWSHVPEYVLFFLFAGVVVAHMMIARHAWKFMKIIKALRQKTVAKLSVLEGTEKS